MYRVHSNQPYSDPLYQPLYKMHSSILLLIMMGLFRERQIDRERDREGQREKERGREGETEERERERERESLFGVGDFYLSYGFLIGQLFERF